MGLSQEKVGNLLKRATSTLEVEEVLKAYCFAKYQHGGNTAQVLRKLHLLTLYLNAVQLGSILRTHYSAFSLVAFLLRNSTIPLSSSVPHTALGLEAWNSARRPSKSFFHRVYSRGTLTPGSNESSDNEMEAQGENGGRGGRGRPAMRTRESSFGESAEEEQERLRRLAGTGGDGGLGRGLLAAPPVYNGGVAAYVAATAMPAGRTPGWELEELPNYA